MGLLVGLNDVFDVFEEGFCIEVLLPSFGVHGEIGVLSVSIGQSKVKGQLKLYLFTTFEHQQQLRVSYFSVRIGNRFGKGSMIG